MQDAFETGGYNVATAVVQATATVPGAGGNQGTPTGVVFSGGTGFVVTTAGVTGPARFIFAADDGTLSAFRNAAGGAVIVGNPPSGTVYKGLAIDSEIANTLLYATNFHGGTVDVFNTQFQLVPVLGNDPSLTCRRGAGRGRRGGRRDR